MTAEPVQLSEYHVFIASPGDRHHERDAIHEFFRSYNFAHGRQRSVRFEVLDWRYHTVGGVGEPQQLVTAQTLDRFADSITLFIGVLGYKYGTPTSTGFSGTEDEFRWALDSHQRLGRPEMLMYFLRPESLFLPADVIEAERKLAEWKRVVDFRSRVENTEPGIFWREYVNLADFESTLSRDLTLWLGHPDRQWNQKRTATLVADDIDQTVDWDGAPEINSHYGRDAEMTKVDGWLGDDATSIIAIGGMGGIGKTSFALSLAQRPEMRKARSEGGLGFDCIIWRRLLNAPPIEELLADILLTITGRETVGSIKQLIQELRARRCLLLLDNFEGVLSAEPGGEFRQGYDGYADLLDALADSTHSSIAMITSREYPAKMDAKHTRASTIKLLDLDALGPDECRQIFNDVGSFSEASAEDWTQLTALYRGNPLAFQLAARHIMEVFDANLHMFLRHGSATFSDLEQLLDWHLSRLSEVERELVYWLAVNRSPVSVAELAGDILTSRARHRLPSTLQSLNRRLPLERKGHRFTLQPVLVEFATDQLVGAVGEEISLSLAEADAAARGHLVERVAADVTQGTFDIINRFAVTKASSPDAIRSSQQTLIATPILHRLREELVGDQGIRAALHAVVANAQASGKCVSGYAAGNAAHLLRLLDGSVSNIDFSNTCVWQAVLDDVTAQSTDFSGCDLTKSSFASPLSAVFAVAARPGVSHVVTADTNNLVRLWDPRTLEPLGELHGHTGWVRTVALDPTGAHLVSGGEDGRVCFWDVHRRACIANIEAHNHWVNAVAIQPDGTLIASAGEDGSVRVWDMPSGELRFEFLGHRERVRTIAFSPDGAELLTGGSDGDVRTWSLSSGQCVNSWNAHTDWVMCLSFSPDGDRVASASFDSTVVVWSRDGKNLKTIDAHSDWVWCVAWSTDGDTLASCGREGVIVVCDPDTGEVRQSLIGHVGTVRALAFCDDLLISCGEDHTVRAWDANAGTLVKTRRGYPTASWSVSVARNSQRVVSGGDDSLAHIWDIDRQARTGELRGHSGRIWCTAVSADGASAATASADRTVRVWDLDTLECRHVLRGHADWVLAVAMSDDGKLIASGGTTSDAALQVWDAITGEPQLRLPTDSRRTQALCFSPNGELFAHLNDHYVLTVWHLADSTCVTMSRSDVVATNLTKRTTIGFSPQGDRIVYASAAGQASVVDTRGHAKVVLGGHAGDVTAAVFCEEGTIVATACSDEVIRLWNAESGELLRSVPSARGSIWSLDSDGSGMLVASTQKGTIVVLDLPSATVRTSLQTPRLYEGMNIHGATGLTDAARNGLRALGAVSRP